MNIPRKRRYPMQPITPELRFHFAMNDLRKAMGEPIERLAPDRQATVGLAAKLIAARNGKRAAHAWTTNLTHEPVTFDFTKGTVE